MKESNTCHIREKGFDQNCLFVRFCWRFARSIVKLFAAVCLKFAGAIFKCAMEQFVSWRFVGAVC